MRPNCCLKMGLLVACATTLAMQSGDALAITLSAVKDNTLFRYDPNDANSLFNSNGSGDFFSAGVTSNRDQIRRGLIQFDLSSVPSNMQVVPGSVHLLLRVVGFPKNDTSARPFWVIRLSGLSGQWGEGASTANISVSGSGSGAAAQLGDATWFHTSYDPGIHPDPDVFSSGAAGFWNQPGALGDSAISNPAGMFGAPAGTTGNVVGPVDFHSESMEADINLWLTNPAQNFGWTIIGDEGIESGTSASSKRDFATRNHANSSFHPVLTFDVMPAPEPPAVLIGLVGMVVAVVVARYHRGTVRLNYDANRAD